jgi:hypothetical protein
MLKDHQRSVIRRHARNIQAHLIISTEAVYLRAFIDDVHQDIDVCQLGIMFTATLGSLQSLLVLLEFAFENDRYETALALVGVTLVRL